MAAAAVVVGLLALRLPATNQAHTDIVGYPISSDFNAGRYPDIWYLAVIGWPLLSLLIFLLGRRLLRAAGYLGRLEFAIHVGRARVTQVPAAPEIDPGSLPERVARAGRVAGVGLVWGYAGATAWGEQGAAFWRDLVAIAAAYVLVLLLAVAAISARPARHPSVLSPVRLVSTLNALGAALTVGGLVAVSQRTTLTTLSDHVQHPMHWLALSLGFVLMAVSLGVVGVSLWRARQAGLDRVRVLERRALFLVAVPVAIFLSTAVLSGGLGAWDNFEAGQGMVTLRLLHLGEVPYRDFLPFHGLLVDTIFNGVGYRLLGASAWGALAAGALIFIPLTWICLYLFAYRLTRGSWAALLTTVLLFFNFTLMFAADRLMLWPLILIVLAVALDRRSRLASFCTGAAAVVLAVLVPEATYAVFACGLALLARDAYHARWPRPRIGRDFRLTLWAVAGGLVVMAGAVGVLAGEGALGGFIDYYATLIPGHGLEGAIPFEGPIPFYMTPITQQFVFFILAPGAVALLAVGILATRVRLRLLLRTSDFLMIAAALFAVPYYGAEFLGRADLAHAALAYGATVPLVMICAWDVARWLNAWMRSLRWRWGAGRLRWPLFYVAAAIAAIATSTSLPTLVAETPTDFRATAATEPWLPDLGYVAGGEGEMTGDVGTFLSAFLEPNQEIYDFSNQPGLYFYLLEYRPASPHFFAGTDYSQAAQDETIADLEANRPEFAVMYGTAPGAIPVWDGIPNTVREYDISQYLLDHYRPLAEIDGQIIYVSRSVNLTIPAWLQAALGSRLTLIDLPFQYPTCSWGYAPEALGAEPPGGDSGVVVGGATAPSETWSLSEPTGHTWPDYQWVQLTIASGSPGAAFTLDDRQVAGEHHDITFETVSGGLTSYRFPIGACTQWHGYSLPTLHLSSSAPVTITQVELLP